MPRRSAGLWGRASPPAARWALLGRAGSAALACAPGRGGLCTLSGPLRTAAVQVGIFAHFRGRLARLTGRARRQRGVGNTGACGHTAAAPRRRRCPPIFTRPFFCHRPAAACPLGTTSGLATCAPGWGPPGARLGLLLGPRVAAGRGVGRAWGVLCACARERAAAAAGRAGLPPAGAGCWVGATPALLPPLGGFRARCLGGFVAAPAPVGPGGWAGGPGGGGGASGCTLRWLRIVAALARAPPYDLNPVLAAGYHAGWLLPPRRRSMPPPACPSLRGWRSWRVCTSALCLRGTLLVVPILLQALSVQVEDTGAARWRR